MKASYKCAVCGYFTLDQRGVYEICPVCFWQDDPSSYPEGGPNDMSIEKAKENYKKYGAVREELADYVRKPYEEERDESKSGIARLKRSIVDEISKFDNRNAEIIADKILNGSGDRSVSQIRQVFSESGVRGLKSYRLVRKITHLIDSLQEDL